MATEIKVEDRFDCSPRALYDLLCDNAFDDGLMKALNMGKELMSETKIGDGVEYKICLTNPEEIPAIAKKFAGDHLCYVETRRWEPARLSNTWVIEPKVNGAKVEAKGTTEIVADGTGCIRRTKGTISVSLPLIGKKIEDMVLQSIKQNFEQNAAYCRKYIQDNNIK